MKHPIFGDLRTVEARRIQRQREATKLRRMMEELWTSHHVVNPLRTSRFVEPMNMGSTRGYQDEIFGH